MAQLSIFEKQKHYSDKDFTCSIGKYDYIYITFRNDSWLRFTSSDTINIRVEGRVLKFDDPATTKQPAAVFKLRTSPRLGASEAAEHTRYIQINGKAWPAILEVVQRTAGSYDFPKKDEPKTSEELAEAYKPDLKKLAEVLSADRTPVRALDDSDKTIPERFMADVRELLSIATTSEERVTIYRTLGAIYGIKQDVLAQLTPKECKVKPEGDPKKWEII